MMDFNYSYIYKNKALGDYENYFKRILKTLYKYLEDLFDQYSFQLEKYKKENNFLAVRFGDYVNKMKGFYDKVDKSYQKIVLDYIAGMTDDYAIECIKEIMIPKQFEFQFHEKIMEN